MWFQSEEGQLPADSAIMEWQNYLDEASIMFGKKLNVAREMAPWMSEAGFEDVKEDVIKVRFYFVDPFSWSLWCCKAQRADTPIKAMCWYLSPRSSYLLGKEHVLAQFS